MGSGRIGLVPVVALALLFSPALLTLARRGVTLARHGFALGKEQRRAYQAAVSDEYRMVRAEVAFLAAPDTLPGDIFVAGNPLYYLLSGRRSAVASNGWVLEIYLPEQWTGLVRQLDAARPPYLFIESGYLPLIRQRSPQMARFLARRYRVLRRGEAGVWYSRRPARTSSP